MGQLSSANNLFVLELFHTLNESNPTGNTIFSPVSISSALAMVYLGARGSTAAQLSKKVTKTVKMMYLKNNLPLGYIPDLKCKVLEMPFQGEELNMVILLPEDIEDETTGLEEIEKQLTLEKLQECENLQNIDVCVKLPKFKMEESYILNSNLGQLGVQDLFSSSKADLSGMSGSRDLFVSKTVHKSYVEVNEEGTETDAAMPGTVVGCCLMPMEFTVDHPFLFFIRHNPTAHVFFLGRVCSP